MSARRGQPRNGRLVYATRPKLFDLLNLSAIDLQANGDRIERRRLHFRAPEHAFADIHLAGVLGHAGSAAWIGRANEPKSSIVTIEFR